MTGVPGFAPQWPAPPNVRAWVTERGSAARYGTLNLALHVGDGAVVAVFAADCERLALRPSRAVEQIHGTRVLDLDSSEAEAMARPTPVAGASS
jgi:copper oxidase (laccase) domain-containing protein